jgi:hypothetical protein
MARTQTWVTTTGSHRRLGYSLPDPSGQNKTLYIEAMAIDSEASNALAATSTASNVSTPSAIGVGGTNGAPINLAGTRLCGFILGAAWTAGTLGFDVSLDGATYVPLYNPVDNTIIAYQVAASRGYSVDPALYAGWPYLRPRSSVAQTGGATITLAAQVV